MDFSPRFRQILLIMLKTDKILSVKNIAEKINVSKRTVQRELEHTESLLKKYNITLCTKTGIGIWLEGTQEHKNNLLNILEEKNIINSSDKQDRRKRLILEILKDKEPKKLYYYSNIFGVSEATISGDMETLQSWFEKFNLKIVRKQGYGVTLEGSEKNYRMAVRKFIDENIESQIVKNLFNEKDRFVLEVIGGKYTNNVYHILDENILKRVITCFFSIKDKRISMLTENSYIGLVFHVTIAISRIIKGEIIEPNDDFINKFKDDENYKLALIIADSLKKEFQVDIPEIEISYICLHLKGSKLQHINKQSAEKEDIKLHENIMNFINTMIDTYDEDFAYELKQDEEFINGLIAHLQPTFIRLKNQMNISNPLLEQIKQNYSEVYLKCKNVGKLIEKKLNCQIPEAEIGFLAIHFGAAIFRIENERERKRKVNIGIVCASGIGISRLMCIKLKNFLKSRAELTTYGKEDITQHIEEKTDFFISSIDLENILSLDVIRVSPLLTENDLIEIDKKVRFYEKIPNEKNEDSDFSKQLEQINFVSAQIKRMIKDFLCIKVDNKITFNELVLAISENITPYYEYCIQIQKDILNREKIGTQIIPEMGFALLHCVTKGVLKPIFSICITKDRKEFKDPYFKNIRTVIIMLIPDDENKKENSNILGYISESIIDDETFLKTILNNKPDEIKHYFTKLMKKYFNQYLDTI